jgi:hypothetical protein
MSSESSTGNGEKHTATITVASKALKGECELTFSDGTHSANVQIRITNP